MPNDKWGLDAESNVNPSYLKAAKVLFRIAVISFVFMLGGCASCIIGSDVTYDSQETYYQKSDGSVGYGAKSYGEIDKVGALLFVIGGGVSFLSIMGSTFVRVLGEKD